MARQLESEVEVQASPERVWEVLTDFAAYPDWNPFIVRAPPWRAFRQMNRALEARAEEPTPTQATP